jgi:hypothetical protein
MADHPGDPSDYDKVAGALVVLCVVLFAFAALSA